MIFRKAMIYFYLGHHRGSKFLSKLIPRKIILTKTFDDKNFFICFQETCNKTFINFLELNCFL